MLQSLHDLSEMKLTHWNKEMLYPYENKFLNYNEIAPSLTGYARIILKRNWWEGRPYKRWLQQIELDSKYDRRIH
jgi:hypothetical protein